MPRKAETTDPTELVVATVADGKTGFHLGLGARLVPGRKIHTTRGRAEAWASVFATIEPRPAPAPVEDPADDAGDES